MYAQDCGCTAEQVRANTVAPCDILRGEVVTVRTAGEFRAAIDQANARTDPTTILVENGTYRIASTSSFPYLTANSAVIRSRSGQRDSVILEGTGMRDVAPATEDGLLIAGDQVIIADLTIRNVGNHGIQVSGHGLLVHNVRIQNTYQQMLKGATDRATIDSGTVQCCLFEYTEGIGPNYYIGGIDVHKGRGWIVRDNLFESIQSPAGSVAEHAVHFWNNSASSTVERNIILNCDRGIGFGLGTSRNSGGVIRNNFIYNNGTGVFPDVGIGLESSPDSKVYNNTIFVSYSNAIEYRFTETRNVEIINNLTNRSIRLRDGATATLAANITDAQADFFVDADAGDLHLASALHGVVDIGSDLSTLVSDDIDKTPRPQGRGYDIGAHEWAQPSSVGEAPASIKAAIYPNPGSGVFTMSTDRIGLDVVVLDALGRRVFSEHLAGNSTIVDLRGRCAGIYLFVFRDGTGRVRKQMPVVFF